ncbi:MAG: amidase [Chloroflexota bacterium]|nr:amidase [Chloroflexota bacterium]
MVEDDVCYLSAIELGARFRDRSLSPVEVTAAILTRIERLNPTLTAFITISAERAMAHANAAERVFATDIETRALTGIPISIKDLTPTKGIRTTRGSLRDPNWVPDEDAPFVERVLAAGAVLLGKTNTPELGWKGDSGNRVVGPTHNPWRHGQTAGGSSGGAAAAVAAGLGPLAQGSDGAGSIRIPAAFCGIVGFKPSFGLVPQYPPSLLGDLSHLGPMTRSVRDAALLLDVTAGADIRDRLSWSSGETYLESCEGGIAGLRIAWSPDLGYAAIDPPVLAMAKAAAHRFTELGAHVEEAHPRLGDPWDIIQPLWACAMAGYHGPDLDRLRNLLDPGLLTVILAGQTIPMTTLARAHQARNAYYQDWRSFMERFDLLLTPTLPITAFAAGNDQPGNVAGHTTDFLSWTAFTYPFNLTGQPAISVPCGFVDGLPIGLQIVGRPRADATVLRAAAAFESVAPWKHSYSTLSRSSG